MQPFLPQEAIRLDVRSPSAGDWEIAISNGDPDTFGYLLIRDRSGVALQMHPTSYASIVSEPKTVRVSLAPVDAKGDPLLDAMEAYSEGLEITEATMSWHGTEGLIERRPMDRSGPWLEQSFTPVESGPHECRIQVEGVDSQGHRFLRTGIHHFYAEDAVEITQITIENWTRNGWPSISCLPMLLTARLCSLARRCGPSAQEACSQDAGLAVSARSQWKGDSGS